MQYILQYLSFLKFRIKLLLLFLKILRCLFSIAALSLKIFRSLYNQKFSPKLSTCSFEAILTSVAKTTAPILLRLLLLVSQQPRHLQHFGWHCSATVIIMVLLSKYENASITTCYSKICL